nr:hypothetical protein [Malaciobacter halophilus]
MYNIEIIENEKKWLAFVKPVSYDEAIYFAKKIIRGRKYDLKVY